MQNDDGLEWLREIRADLARRFDHDPRKIGEYYRKLQNEHPSRLFKRRVKAPAAK